MSKYIFNNDTDILEFLEQLRENGIQIWGEGEKIRYRSKNRQLAPETLRILKMAKGQILDFFRMIEKNVIPLTSIQTAYVVGQTAGCELGNINAHYYIEYTIESLDVERLEQMINLVISKNDALRLIVTHEGKASFLDNVPYYSVPVYSLYDGNDREQKRLERSHHRYNYYKWPMANMICDKEIIALEPSAYMRTAFMARLMEHNEVKERISLLPIDVGKYSFRDKISGVMCMGVLGHLKRDEQEKLLYKLDKNLNINVPILIELLEPKFLVAPVGSRISVATQGRLRYETYITDIKQVGMDQWTWRLTYKVFCGKNIVSTVDSLMSWNYQSVEKILNQLTKMHFRTAKLSETLLLAIKAR